ncbi:hypothetical protein DFJ73DRAFT_783911 [Zopfochytrium polystomum]|nr:hypothetical protein DFJ73DRAFT_783911 [Zopfochytrium polystomum]
MSYLTRSRARAANAAAGAPTTAPAHFLPSAAAVTTRAAATPTTRTQGNFGYAELPHPSHLPSGGVWMAVAAEIIRLARERGCAPVDVTASPPRRWTPSPLELDSTWISSPPSPLPAPKPASAYRSSSNISWRQSFWATGVLFVWPDAKRKYQHEATQRLENSLDEPLKTKYAKASRGAKADGGTRGKYDEHPRLNLPFVPLPRHITPLRRRRCAIFLFVTPAIHSGT